MSLFRGPTRERRTDHPTNSALEMLRRRLPPSSAGVDNATAMRHSAVYACVDRLTSIVSGFPIDVYRKVNGVRVPVDDPRPIIDNPSAELDAVDWRCVVMACWLLRGNAFGLVTGLRGAYPKSIELIHPDRVSLERKRKDSPVQWSLDGAPVDLWPRGELWHAPGKILHPATPLGSSVLEHARYDAALGLAARRFGSEFFSAGGHPTAVLLNDKAQEEGSVDGAKRIKMRFLDSVRGREPVVLTSGWKLEKLQVAPEESQFLETIKANDTTIARFFGMPATMIDAPSSTGMTYQNTSQKGDDLLRFTVNSWAIRMERMHTRLLVRPEFAKCNVDSLLRADAATRAKIHDMSIRGGWHSVNDVRRIEDEPPIEDGDNYLWPPGRGFPLPEDTDEGVQHDGSSQPS